MASSKVLLDAPNRGGEEIPIHNWSVAIALSPLTSSRPMLIHLEDSDEELCVKENLNKGSKQLTR